MKPKFFIPHLHLVFMCFLPENKTFSFMSSVFYSFPLKSWEKITVISLSLPPILSLFSVCQFSSFSSDILYKELLTRLHSLQFRVDSFFELLRLSFVLVSSFSLKGETSVFFSVPHLYIAIFKTHLLINQNLIIPA